jgi:hypothetical protein
MRPPSTVSAGSLASNGERASLSGRYTPATILLIAAVLGTGMIAAQRVAPVFWITTVGLAGIIAFVERRALPQPIANLDDDSAVSALPPELRRAVGAALARLAPGAARDLLGDLVRRTQPLLSALQGRSDDRGTIRDVTALLEASCALAMELARVDVFLALPASPSADKLHARCRETRVALLQRLRDAGAAIDALHAQLLEEGSEAGARVAELAAEISEEARARGEAAREMDALLGGSPT